MLVLAGGRSSRMGRDKAGLEVEGRPMLRRIVEAGRASGLDQIVVVGSPGQPLPPLPPGVMRRDDPDDAQHDGPLRGLWVGLRALAEQDIELACLTGCDAIWLDAAHVSYVLRLLEDDRACRAVVPESGRRADGSPILHPLCGAVRVPIAVQTALTLLRAGRRAARALPEALGARRIDARSLPEPRVVRGCNTPAQWRRAVEELERRGPPEAARMKESR